MTEEQQKEVNRQIDAMLSNPDLAPYIQQFPSGAKGMSLEHVKELLYAMAERFDVSLNEMIARLTDG